MKYINELLDIGMGSVIDMSTEKMIMEDEIYRKDLKDSEEIFEKLAHTLSQEQKNLVNDYISCLMSANERACNLTYLAAAKNTICFLAEANAIKGYCE